MQQKTGVGNFSNLLHLKNAPSAIQTVPSLISTDVEVVIVPFQL
jgi:hypothetical protein